MAIKQKQIGSVAPTLSVTANGALSLTSAAIDTYRIIPVQTNTAGLNLTLPAPTDLTTPITTLVSNVGGQAFTLYGSKIEPGNFSFFTWNNSAWQSLQIGYSVNVVRYASGSGNYTPTAGCVLIEVEMVGGGGGGGGSAPTSASQVAMAGGGSGGGYLRFLMPPEDVAIYPWTVGTGGAGGGVNAPGGAGSATSFGGFAMAGGGPGGLAGPSVSTGAAIGSAGNATNSITAQTGMLTLRSAYGEPGGPGFALLTGIAGTSIAVSGSGGGSIFGPGAPGVVATTTAQVAGIGALQPGAAGSGAATGTNSVSINTNGPSGGAGQAGLIIIREYF